MSKSWETTERGRGRKTVFNLDGLVLETGAAGTRCFNDLVRQRGKDRALDAVLAGYRVHGSAFPGSQGAATFDVTVERMLLGAGVPEGRVPDLARAYRSDRATGIDLSTFDSA